MVLHVLLALTPATPPPPPTTVSLPHRVPSFLPSFHRPSPPTPDLTTPFQFAFCIWMAGTLGTVAGTIVYPARGPEVLSILAEMGASTLLT